MHLAQEAPGLYRMAGTWPELMAQAELVFLLPPAQNNWPNKLMQAALQQNDAFWAASLRVASRETIVELDAAIYRLLEAKGPDAGWQPLMDKVVGQTRLHRRLTDLQRLLELIPVRPESLQKMADLLATQQSPLRSIRVYYDDGSMHFNAWQLAVLDKLHGDAPAPDPRMQSLLETSLEPPETSNPVLKEVRNLYTSTGKPPQTINGVRVIAVRDSLAEAEITAGLIQTALANGSRLTDIGLLLPENPLSLMAVENVFERCGIPLSGFHRSTGQRDLSRETLRAFLLCLRKPAPIMAIATLLTSPLMPWSMEQGHVMAQGVMDGDVLLKSTQIPSAARKVMDLLDNGATTPQELQRQLKNIHKLLSSHEKYYDHMQRAHEATDRLQAALSAMAVLDWDSLLYLVTPESSNVAKPAQYWQEALPVFHEGALPWCAVSHLFVLGFNENHYPAGAGASSVFSDAEWEEIALAGWPVLTNDLIRQRQRTIFAEQLSAAKDNLTLLMACRDAGGKALEPSASLVFLSRSLGVEPDALVLNIDRSEDVRQIPDLPLADIMHPSPPRELISADIELKVDLLEVFGRKTGELAPLSPSAADTLMVSPFAWLLGRLGCDPRAWGTDEFDVLKAGTLAHRVFEELFETGQPLPDEKEISERVPKILRERMLQITPFLRSPDWRVERFKFESEVLRAAIHWKKLLASCKASIVSAEQWLRGTHGDVPLHGQSDLLLQLPSGKLLVVDYKKSSSGKRRDRMRSGFDLQAHLYRLMIQTGGLPEFESPSDDIGIVYYLLNDTTALADSDVDDDGKTPGWEVLSTDISSQAMQRLDRRLLQIRKGTIRLNATGDENWWKKNAGLPIYALDNSPLLRLFMHNEEDT
jgi:hypothetical protein